MLSGVRFIASPNCDWRANPADVRLLVVHNISLPPGQFGGDGVIELFTHRLDPGAHPYYAGIHGLRVSAHFFIRRDGELIQFVPCGKRAWHAGVSSWRGWERCNDFSLGVELEGDDNTPFTDAQYSQLNALIAQLQNCLSCARDCRPFGHCTGTQDRPRRVLRLVAPDLHRQIRTILKNSLRRF